MATYIAGRPGAQGGEWRNAGDRRTYLSSAVFARWTRFFVQSPLARTGWEGDEEGAEDGAAAPVAIARGSVRFAGRADEGFWGVSPPGPPVTVPPSFLLPSSLARQLPPCHLWLPLWRTRSSTLIALSYILVFKFLGYPSPQFLAPVMETIRISPNK